MLRLSGAIPPQPLWAFMTCSSVNFTLTFTSKFLGPSIPQQNTYYCDYKMRETARQGEKACDAYGVEEGAGVKIWSKQTTWKT